MEQADELHGFVGHLSMMLTWSLDFVYILIHSKVMGKKLDPLVKIFYAGVYFVPPALADMNSKM